MSDKQKLGDGKRPLGPPPGFPARTINVTSQSQGKFQVSYTPVYNISTSTPKFSDNDTKHPSLLANSAGFLPSPITKQKTERSSGATKLGTKSVVLGAFSKGMQKSRSYQFTGNEKPFVPRTILPAPTEKNPRRVHADQKLQLSTQNTVPIPANDILRTPVKDQSDLSLSPLNPLQFVPLVQSTVPALQPISPIRQMQMELEAGMKPSLPRPLNFKQRPSQVNTKPVGPDTLNSTEVRPILGRKFNNHIQIGGRLTEGTNKHSNFSNRGAIPPAHSNHKLSTLAAQDSAILLSQNAFEPLDLSRKAPNDYARVWSQMSMKSTGNKFGSDEQLMRISARQPLFTRNEKPLCPSEGIGSIVRPELISATSKSLNVSQLCTSHSVNGELIHEPVNEKKMEPDQECGVDRQTISKKVSGFKKTLATEASTTGSEDCRANTRQSVSESEFGSDSKLVLVGNNSSTSTLPYEEDPVEPLNLSQAETEDTVQEEESDSPPPDEKRDFSPDTMQTADGFLVMGHAIKVKSEENVSHPLESSEGLMDSVFEEDMIKGDSNLASPQNSTGTAPRESPPLRLCGNNIWEGPNLNEGNAVIHSDSDSYVSDSEEEGYLTCNTSAGCDAGLESPIIDVLGRNDSGRGYSVYKKSDTPTKVLRWLEHSSEGLRKDTISDLVYAVQKDQRAVDETAEANSQHSRVVLKGIQHMLLSSHKLEEIITFGSEDQIASNTNNSQLASVVKAYINATTRCVNKIAQIVKNESKKKAQTSTAKKDLPNAKSKKGKKPQSKAKASKSQKKLHKSKSNENHPEDKTIEEESRICPEEHSIYRGVPLIGAVDLVTKTPITGNRYWKKRMLRQNLGEEPTSSTVKDSDQSIPERRGLLSASYSDDDDDEPAGPSAKLTWTHCCKFQSSGLKLLGSDKKNRSKDEKFCPYKKLKNPTQKGTKGKVKNVQKKRKRSKDSPTGISPPNKNVPQKKIIATDEVVAHITSSNRRHFPYQMQCNRVIDSVYNLPESYPFREEFRDDEEPNYYKVIKYPMFFELVTSKLRQRLYYQLKDFVSDVRRVFWNTRHFYRDYQGETVESSRTLQYCERVEAYFETKLKSAFPFMEFSDITGSPQAEKVKLKNSDSIDSNELDVFQGQKVKGALRELWK